MFAANPVLRRISRGIHQRTTSSGTYEALQLGEQGCLARRVEKLAMALGLDSRNADILLKLALEVENEKQKEREALRSPGLRNESRDLKESMRSLEEQVRQLQEYVRFPLPQQAPQEGNRPG